MRLLVLLLAACAFAQASEFAYRIAAPAGSRIEAPAVTRLGDWEVAVSFDEVRCEILCVYRNRSERIPIFLPPVVAVRIHSGMRVSTAVFDPAHTRDHSMRRLDRLADPEEPSPARTVALCPLTAHGAVSLPVSPPPARRTVVARATLPLRI